MFPQEFASLDSFLTFGNIAKIAGRWLQDRLLPLWRHLELHDVRLMRVAGFLEPLSPLFLSGGCTCFSVKHKVVPHTIVFRTMAV